jgi:oligopeptide transport system substrate-binding protein
MESRRLLLVLAGIAVAAAVVIGGLALLNSGGDGGGSSASGPGQSGEPSPNLPERKQGELRLFGPDPITLDPACAADVGSAEYIIEIFSGLVSFDLDLKIIPDIAERWETSDDGKLYTFHLRTNVMFHDASRRVTAGDFKFSMERALNPKTQSTVGDVYLDDIAGVDEFTSGQADEVSGIKAVNDDTLEITIKEPSAVFLEKLTYPTAYVVDRREVGDSTCFEGDWMLHPNGTGPFKLTNWVLSQRIELEPNQSFYLDPKPSLSKVTYVLAGGSPLVMYENDEIDVTGVGANDIQRVRDPNEPLNKEYHETPSMDVFYIGFNVKEPPFDNPKVREALSLAIDRDLLANQILEGLVVPAEGILPPGIPGYRENLKGLAYDPDRAVQLLKDAGGPDVLKGAKILTSGQGASPSQVLEAVVAMWEEKLGVTVEIEQEETGVFFRDIEDGNFQMSSLGWVADYPDPQNFLEIKLHSNSRNNDNFYSNPDADRLLDQARAESNQDKRLQLYQQAEDLMLKDLPWTPLYHGKSNYLAKPYVKGYSVPPFVIPNLRYVTIER